MSQLQIYTDEKVESSKEAQLFINRIKLECELRDIECIEVEYKDLDNESYFIIPHPNNLITTDISLLKTNRNNLEYQISVADIVYFKLLELEMELDATKEKPMKVTLFGGNGKVCQNIRSLIVENFMYHDIELLPIISSEDYKHKPAEIAMQIAKSDVIVSAIPYNHTLLMDGFSKHIIDVGNNLSEYDKSRFASFTSCGEISEKYVSILIDKTKVER